MVLQSVMGLFAVGNILLKYKRGRLPREAKVNWVSVIFGFTAIVTGTSLVYPASTRLTCIASRQAGLGM